MQSLSLRQIKRNHAVKNCNHSRVASRVLDVLRTEDVRIVRVVGKPGSGFTPILKTILSSPPILRSSILIENIYFDSEHGLLGWVSNALGLYEGAVATRGKVPKHLPEILRLRGVKYLFFDNFHDAFYLSGVSMFGMVKDINALLCACVDLRLIVAQTVSHHDQEFTSQLMCPVYDIST